MATGFASVLSEGQHAQLDLGEEVVRCTVVGFSGADVVLEVGKPAEEPAQGSVAFLLLEAEGRLHALKTAIRPGTRESEMTVTLLDSFRLGQRRLFSRAPLVLPAHLRPAGDAEKPWTSFTRDISAGGLRVARQSSYRPADLHEVVLGLVKVEREIRALATVVRASDKDLSLSFSEIDADDRLLLAQLTFAYHRRGAVT